MRGVSATPGIFKAEISFVSRGWGSAVREIPTAEWDRGEGEGFHSVLRMFHFAHNRQEFLPGSIQLRTYLNCRNSDMYRLD